MRISDRIIAVAVRSTSLVKRLSCVVIIKILKLIYLTISYRETDPFAKFLFGYSHTA